MLPNRNIVLLTAFMSTVLLFESNRPVQSMGMTSSCSATPLTFSGGVDADFGNIDGLGPGTVSMGTNGDITYTGSFSGPAVGTIGTFIISGDTKCYVDVSCSTTGTMTLGGDSITMTGIEIVSSDNARGAYGTGVACNGIGNVVIPDINLNNPTRSRTIYIGGVIDATGGVPAGGGTFSTANSGGSSIQVEVTYTTP